MLWASRQPLWSIVWSLLATYGGLQEETQEGPSTQGTIATDCGTLGADYAVQLVWFASMDLNTPFSGQLELNCSAGAHQHVAACDWPAQNDTTVLRVKSTLKTGSDRSMISEQLCA